MNAVLSEINSLVANGVTAKNICVVARTHKLLDDYIAQFTGSRIRCYEIKGNKADDRALDGIRVATMHRVKGLEFQYVFIVASNKRIIPLASAIDHIDTVSEQETMTAEKRLPYVALTHAQKGAYSNEYGQMSEFLKYNEITRRRRHERCLIKAGSRKSLLNINRILSLCSGAMRNTNGKQSNAFRITGT